MISLKNNVLKFSFPEVHKQATCRIEFQRTLRIPDDGREYPLPAGLGRFPLTHIEDHAEKVPAQWQKRGGVLLPMYQSEALWINFSGNYPMAIKVAAGKINAVTGEAWSDGLSGLPQDYVVVPTQPWLDGYSVEEGLIRQFVAMPLGSGYSAEEQITGEAEFGGIQLIAYPMKAEFYERLQAERRKVARKRKSAPMMCSEELAAPCESMGLAAGGLMRQVIHTDPHGIHAWDRAHTSRCFVHLLNSEHYQGITGHKPPHPPLSKAEYQKQGIPWFEHYADRRPGLPGSTTLAGVKSIKEVAEDKQEGVWDNNSMNVGTVKTVGALNKNEVSEGEF